MATTSSSLYPGQQQQQQQALLGDQTGPANANAAVAAVPNQHLPASSIGPFFAVMSVLVVLAVLSCYMGRICACRKAMITAEDPLEMINAGGGGRGWLRRKWRRCLSGDIEAGAKVADCAGKETARDSDATPA